jgi:hypothetical protein
MDTSTTEFKLRSWNRFITRNFQIKPDLIGKLHTFIFRSATITIRIPKKSHVNRSEGFDQIAFCTAYQVEGGVEVPLYYNIEKVDVEVNLGSVESLPPAILTQQCNAYGLVSSQTQHKLNLHCDEHAEIAAQAFDYWLAVLRWSADNYSIGRYEVVDNNSGWSTYMHEVSTNRKVWIAGITFKVPSSRVVTKEHWRDAAAKLRKGIKPAPYFTILHEAEEYLERKEFRRSLIDMAVATELYIRAVYMSRLPKQLDPYLIKKIERIGITEFTEHIFSGVLNSEDKKKFTSIKADLKSMFDTRNLVMHAADYGVANEPLCKKYLASAKFLQRLSSVKQPSN